MGFNNEGKKTPLYMSTGIMFPLGEKEVRFKLKWDKIPWSALALTCTICVHPSLSGKRFRLMLIIFKQKYKVAIDIILSD